MSESTAKTAKMMTVGVIMAERLYAGLIVDHKLSGALLSLPPQSVAQDAEDDNSMVEMPAEEVFASICKLVLQAAKGH